MLDSKTWCWTSPLGVGEVGAAADAKTIDDPRVSSQTTPILIARRDADAGMLNRITNGFLG